MILPQIFWFPRKMFFTWEKIKCSHQETANIFSWNLNFVELFLKIGDFPKICDRRSFYDHSQNIWSMITHDHDRQKLEKYDLQSLMIVIWSEMIGVHDPIRLTLDGSRRGDDKTLDSIYKPIYKVNYQISTRPWEP